jgi:thiosulfate dehydrogenase [quinone] large subunit
MAGQPKKKIASGGAVWYAVAIVRLLLGFIFLWAFFDKLFGWNHATTSVQAWVNGGSPTKGFLVNAQGPFASFFHGMAGHTWADWLFMIGLAGIGVALLLGIIVRFAVVVGSILLALMWMASLPIATNPAIDEHIVYIVALWVVFLGYPNQVLSLGSWWRGSLGRGRWLW